MVTENFRTIYRLVDVLAKKHQKVQNVENCMIILHLKRSSWYLQNCFNCLLLISHRPTYTSNFLRQIHTRIYLVDIDNKWQKYLFLKDLTWAKWASTESNCSYEKLKHIPCHYICNICWTHVSVYVETDEITRCIIMHL